MNRRIALVTGSSQGIGKGIALELAKANYDVAINYNSNKEGAVDTADKVKELGGKAEVYRANIQNLDEIQAMFNEFSMDFDHIDLLVNNAGITRMKPMLEVTEKMWNEVINTDLRGTFFCAQAAAKLMTAKNTKGVIINITSNHQIGCWPNSTVYATAKAGEEKMTKNMALDLSQFGIRVCAIAPGYTQLDRFHEGVLEKYVKSISKRIPIQRFASVEEIGAAVVFLASEKAGYITGTTLLIDGGETLPVVADNRFF